MKLKRRYEMQFTTGQYVIQSRSENHEAPSLLLLLLLLLPQDKWKVT
jgi:hypothetical protein